MSRVQAAGAVLELPDAVRLELLSILGDGLALDLETRRAHGADWWPISRVWAARGELAALPAAVALPRTVDHVAAVLEACNRARIPVTLSAGQSSVCGQSVPVGGGLVVDLSALDGVLELDDESLAVTVEPGIPRPCARAGAPGARPDAGSLPPQSFELSTVGGWLACRSDGQFSTRYGKIEELLLGLDVVLANGDLLRFRATPAAADGLDLRRLFTGSEGTLGAIAAAVLIVLAEGEPDEVARELRVLEDECAGAQRLDDALVDTWLVHRYDVSALDHAVAAGLVVDTIEVAALWRDLPSLYERGCEAIASVEHTVVTSGHCSHAYGSGGCLYFTFAGMPPPEYELDPRASSTPASSASPTARNRRPAVAAQRLGSRSMDARLSDGVTLFVEPGGEGFPVFVLHGGPARPHAPPAVARSARRGVSAALRRRARARAERARRPGHAVARGLRAGRRHACRGARARRLRSARTLLRRDHLDLPRRGARDGRRVRHLRRGGLVGRDRCRRRRLARGNGRGRNAPIAASWEDEQTVETPATSPS